MSQEKAAAQGLLHEDVKLRQAKQATEDESQDDTDNDGTDDVDLQLPDELAESELSDDAQGQEPDAATAAADGDDTEARQNTTPGGIGAMPPPAGVAGGSAVVRTTAGMTPGVVTPAPQSHAQQPLNQQRCSSPGDVMPRNDMSLPDWQAFFDIPQLSRDPALGERMCFFISSTAATLVFDAVKMQGPINIQALTSTLSCLSSVMFPVMQCDIDQLSAEEGEACSMAHEHMVLCTSQMYEVRMWRNKQLSQVGYYAMGVLWCCHSRLDQGSRASPCTT